MGLFAELGDDPVALDTVIFIYFVARHPRFYPLVRQLFERIARGELKVVTSALTLHETLIVPYRKGDRALASRYEAIVTQNRAVRFVEVTRYQHRSAALVRAVTRVKTADSFHIAAALTNGCKTFLTNDRVLPTIRGLRVLQLSSYLPV
jgi:predicted nucleic acid-binding protein